MGRYEEVMALMQQIIEADPKDKRAATLAKQAKTELDQKIKLGSSNG